MFMNKFMLIAGSIFMIILGVYGLAKASEKIDDARNYVCEKLNIDIDQIYE